MESSGVLISPSRPVAHKELGRLGEKAAVRWLRSKRYLIIEQNFKDPRGELDIIARHGDFLVFVEVKTRRRQDYGRPIEAVGAAKQTNISRLAARFCQKYQLQEFTLRFDVIEVEARPLLWGLFQRWTITHYPGAF